MGRSVHLNGRVYDPFTGRFLSADPEVQDPYHSQSYNRYTYVWNNPTNNTDPTGFACTGSANDTSGCKGQDDNTKKPTPTGPNGTYTKGDWDKFTASQKAAAFNAEHNGTGDGLGNAISRTDNNNTSNAGPAAHSATSKPGSGMMDKVTKAVGDYFDSVSDVVDEYTSGHHEYDFSFPQADGVSARDAFNMGRLFTAPLAPYAEDGSHQRNLASISDGIDSLFGTHLNNPNPIIQIVDPVTMTITNVAYSPHMFVGTVQMTYFTDSSGRAWEHIHAEGEGKNAVFNQVLGSILFYSFGAATQNFAAPPVNPIHPSGSMKAN